MPPQSTLISALDLNTRNAMLHVRATRVWEAFSINPTRSEKKLVNTKVVFIDREGSEIMLTVWNNQKQDYFPLLKEGLVYDISGFRMVPNIKTYRAVDMDLALSFDHRTHVVPVGDSNLIPYFKFNPTNFEDIPSLLWNTRNLIEIVGLLKDIGEPETASNGANKIELLLLDSRNNSVVVNLWEERATQFQTGLEAVECGPTFVLITGLLVKKYSGNIIVSSGDATKTYFNIDCPPLMDLKKTMLEAADKGKELIPPPAKQLFVSAPENALKKATIQEILEVRLAKEDNQMRFICEATIVNISQYTGWYYNSCPKCPKGIKIEGARFFCEACSMETTSYTQRYLITVGVQDDSGRTTFTIINNDAQRLIGIPIQSVIANLGQDKLTSEVPPLLNNIIGKRCAFEVKVGFFNQDGRAGYTVARLVELPNTPTNSEVVVDNNQEGPTKKMRVT